MGSDGHSVVLATSTEEELAHWMAALCQAAVEEVRGLLEKGGEEVGGGGGWSLHFIPQYNTRFNFSGPILFYSVSSLYYIFLIPWWSTCTCADSHLPDSHKLLLLRHAADSEQGQPQTFLVCSLVVCITLVCSALLLITKQVSKVSRTIAKCAEKIASACWCAGLHQQKGGTGGGGWVHSQRAMHMVPAELGYNSTHTYTHPSPDPCSAGRLVRRVSPVGHQLLGHRCQRHQCGQSTATLLHHRESSYTLTPSHMHTSTVSLIEFLFPTMHAHNNNAYLSTPPSTHTHTHSPMTRVYG